MKSAEDYLKTACLDELVSKSRYKMVVEAIEEAQKDAYNMYSRDLQRIQMFVEGKYIEGFCDAVCEPICGLKKTIRGYVDKDGVPCASNCCKLLSLYIKATENARDFLKSEIEKALKQE